jgi:hypothetical protein
VASSEAVEADEAGESDANAQVQKPGMVDDIVADREDESEGRGHAHRDQKLDGQDLSFRRTRERIENEI